jgi:hypothetical protein
VLRGLFFVRLVDGYNLRFARGMDNSIAIIGAPGTGKSVLLDYLLSRVPEDYNVIVIDPTGEHASLKAFGYRVALTGVDAKLNPLGLFSKQEAVEVLRGALEAYWGERLSPIVVFTLDRCAQGAGDLAGVVGCVEEVAASSQREDERNAAAALLRRLQPMLSPALLGEEPLPYGRVVVDLSAVPGEEAKTAFAITLLFGVYVAAKSGGWEGIVVVDEADRLGDVDIVNRSADELRKYNVSIWAVGHSVSRVARKLMDARVRLFFATSDPENIRYLQMLNVKADPSRLQTGQALILARGEPYRLISITVPREILEARRAWRPRRPLSIHETAG